MRKSNRLCSIVGCGRKHMARGFCMTHYTRWMGKSHADFSVPIRAKPQIIGLRPDGYIAVNIQGRKRLAHVVIAEKALGRPLKPPEEIHHVNENRSDNKNSNLVICPDRAYHKLLHIRQKAMKSCGHADWIRCRYCKTYSPPSEIHLSKKHPASTSYHTSCIPSRRGI